METLYFTYVGFFKSFFFKVNADGSAAVVGNAPGEAYLVAVDSAGNLYIDDCSSVLKVDPQGNATHLFSGTECGVAVDSRGNLFISEYGGNPRVWRVTPSGTSSIVAGNGTKGFSGDGGLATAAQLGSSGPIAIDNEDNLLIADSDNLRVRKVTWATETFFAHVAIGDGYSTTVTLINTGDSAISISLILTNPQGQPLTASGIGVGVGSSFPVSISPAGTTFLSINPVGPGDPLKTGWATVATSGGVLNGVATCHFMSGGVIQAIAGILPSQAMRYATIPIDDDSSQGRLTAYAVANPTSQNLVIKLALVSEDGRVVDDSVTFTLAPKQQTARYLIQDVVRPQFKDSLVLRAQEDGSFIAVALRQNQTLFALIQVISGKASRIPD